MTPADIEGFLRQHKDLEKAISSHDWWLGVFTIIVALGIFAETMVEFGYSKDKPRSEKWLTLLCALVVLGGVVGEYCEGDKVADQAGQLQQIADNDVGRLYKEAGDAIERAGHAESHLADARKAASEADARAAEANLALAKFKAPRSLSAKQQARVTASMKPFAGTTFDFASTNSKEPMNLLGQIEDALIAAGWKEVNWPGEIIIGRDGKPSVGMATESGVKVEVQLSRQAELLPLAKMLATTLSTENIPAEAQLSISRLTQTPTELHIVVGDKSQ